MLLQGMAAVIAHYEAQTSARATLTAPVPAVPPVRTDLPAQQPQPSAPAVPAACLLQSSQSYQSAPEEPEESSALEEPTAFIIRSRNTTATCRRCRRMRGPPTTSRSLFKCPHCRASRKHRRFQCRRRRVCRRRVCRRRVCRRRWPTALTRTMASAGVLVSGSAASCARRSRG